MLCPIEEASLTFDGRYVANERAHLEDAFAILATRFADRSTFDAFYATLETPQSRDEFLRVTSFYRYLVKEGDWRITVPGFDPVIDYLTNSYKLIAIFSLIESLSTLEHEDFYTWLSHQEAAQVYPIQDRAALTGLYKKYKKSFGAIRRCVAFFDRLPQDLQQRLCSAVQVKGQPMASIKKLAEFLYDLRSKFVHEARLVLVVSESPIYSLGKKGLTRSALTMSTLHEAFEVGVLAYFRNGTTPPSI